jgi:hypothetical protein
MEDHHYFLHLYGRPEVRLLRSHSIEQTGRRNNIPLTSSIVAMLGAPVLVINQLKAICVNGIVNSVDVKTFVDDLAAKIGWQMTLVSNMIFVPICNVFTHMVRLALSWQSTVAFLQSRSLVGHRRQKHCVRVPLFLALVVYFRE